MSLEKPDPNNVLVYFVKVEKNNFNLASTKRSFDPKTNKLKQVLNALFQGPNEAERKKGFASEIPQGTRLLSLDETKEKITINLSEQFSAGGGSRSMIVRYQQLETTIALNSSGKAIYVLIEGKPLESLGGEGLVANNPIYTGKQNNLSTSEQSSSEL